MWRLNPAVFVVGDEYQIMLPVECEVNWQEVLSALREIGYAGPWLYEVGYAPAKTIRRRKLSARDFVDNAQMIFAGERPVAIGRRIVEPVF